MNTIQTPQKYVPRLHLKSQLRLRPSVKFQMHILAPSDKRLPMHAIKTGLFQTGAVFCGQMRVPLNSSIRLRGYL